MHHDAAGRLRRRRDGSYQVGRPIRRRTVIQPGSHHDPRRPTTAVTSRMNQQREFDRACGDAPTSAAARRRRKLPGDRWTDDCCLSRVPRCCSRGRWDGRPAQSYPRLTGVVEFCRPSQPKRAFHVVGGARVGGAPNTCRSGRVDDVHGVQLGKEKAQWSLTRLRLPACWVTITIVDLALQLANGLPMNPAVGVGRGPEDSSISSTGVAFAAPGRCTTSCAAQCHTMRPRDSDVTPVPYLAPRAGLGQASPTASPYAPFRA